MNADELRNIAQKSRIEKVQKVYDETTLAINDKAMFGVTNIGIKHSCFSGVEITIIQQFFILPIIRMGFKFFVSKWIRNYKGEITSYDVEQLHSYTVEEFTYTNDYEFIIKWD